MQHQGDWPEVFNLSNADYRKLLKLTGICCHKEYRLEFEKLLSHVQPSRSMIFTRVTQRRRRLAYLLQLH